MIVVEERLIDLFSQLPARFGNSKPFYNFGDGLELNAYIIKMVEDKKKFPYPLIYQVSTKERQHTKSDEVFVDLELLLCVQNTVKMYNAQRWATSYRNVLMPLAEDIITSFKKSDIIRSENDWEVEIEKRPNYSGQEFRTKNATIDIIDVIILKTRIIISDGCINTKIFNN